MKPILLSLSSFELYSYPLFIGLAWGIAYHIVHSYFERFNYNKKNLNLFLTVNFVLSWMGSKIFFLLFSTGDQISLYMDNSNFWLGGGFVFYGGFVFCSLFSILSVFKFNMIDKEAIKFFIPALTLAHGVGRIGCFLAGCCYGKETGSVITIHLHHASRYPVQLYESVFLVLLFYLFNKRIEKLNAFQTIIGYFISYGIGRFLLEFLRGDKVRGEILHLSSSQLVSVCIVTVSISSYWFLSKKKPVN